MALRADTIREFGELFATDSNATAQTHRATVKAVEGTTVYVDVSGNGDVTPIETTSADYAIGDVVQVEQRGGRLHVTGNTSQPSVNAQHVSDAVKPVAQAAQSAQTASQNAQRVADEAQAVADAVNQHFFDDTDGIHVTEADRDTWTASKTGKNILINSLGILLRNALNNLVSITASAIAFFDGSGNAASNIVAQFGGSGATIGKSGDMHIGISSSNIEYADGGIVGGTQYIKNIGDMTGSGTDDYMLKNIADTAISNEAAQVVEWNEYGQVQNAPYMCSRMGCAYVTDNDSDGYPDMSTYRWVGSGFYTNVDTLGSSEFRSAALMLTESSEPPNYSTNHTSGYVQLKSDSEWEKPSGHYAPRTELTIEADNVKVDGDGYIYPCATKMPDFVVEQGTSGIWTYRKWHSGVAECWGTYSASIAITSSSASYGGYRSAQITATAFPNGTFSAAPTVTATSMSSGGNWVTNTNGSTSTNAKFYLSCGTSSAASTRDIAIHAAGTWK